MNPRRAVLLVEVDLDPIPGFGHTPGSWRDRELLAAPSPQEAGQ